MNRTNEDLIKNNALYNMLKTITSIVFPMITYQYVFRVLGPNNIGKIEYGNSIVAYFSLIASLGINTYGIRECSKVKNNRKKLDKLSSEIFSINIITMVISYSLLFLTLMMSKKLADYKIIIMILGSNILFCTLGADWINMAMEDYKYITIRTIAFNIISVLLIVLFVKKSNDYIKYVILCVFSTSGANILNYTYRKKHCNTKVTSRIRISNHIKPISILFSLLLSQVIFTNSDITMIGYFNGDWQVGVYSTAVKLYNVVNQVVASVTWVVMPQLVLLFSEGNYNEVNATLEYVLSFIITLAIPCLVGLNVITKEIIVFFAGEHYIQAYVPMHILSITLLISFIGGFLGNTILLSSGKEMICLKASVLGAIINFILNILFIPRWGIIAAASTTAVAQMVCVLYMIKYIDNRIRINNLREIIKAPIIGGIAVLSFALIVKFIIKNAYIVTVVSVVFGAIIYYLILWINKYPLIQKYINDWKQDKNLEDDK